MICFFGKSLIDLQDRDNSLFFPEIVASIPAFHLAIHGILKQDCSKDMLAGKRRTGDDSGSHLMNQIKHLLVIMPFVSLQAIGLQCLRRRTSGLIQCGNKSKPAVHTIQLFFIHMNFYLLSMPL